MSKSAKNEGARAKYKAASSKLRSVEKEFGGNSPAAGSKVASRAIAGAKSGLTRVTKGLRGGTAGNIGSKGGARPAAKRNSAKKPSGMASQVSKGRAAKAAYKSKSASKRKAAVAKAGGSFTKTSTFKNSLKGKQAKARQAKKAAG
jgi:hypothetical protein